MNVKYYTYM